MNRSQKQLADQIVRMFQAGGRSRWLAIGLVVVGAAAWFLFPGLFSGSSSDSGMRADGTIESAADPQLPTVSIPDASTSSREQTRSQESTSARSQDRTESRSSETPRAQRDSAPNQRPSRQASGAGDTAQSELREIGRDTYMTSGGLIYGRGSRHGNRLDHVLAHGRDEPNRPGSHGVFVDGDKLAVVTLIDDAFQRAEAGGRGVKKKEEGRRVVYTIDMGRKIGYVGGQSGNRRGRPDARHIRLVLEGNRVITAFPLVP